jgi:hypothetical protein
MADKPRVTIYVEMSTGRCFFGILDSLLWFPWSTIPMDSRRL